MALMFIKQILSGKTLGRALFNREVVRHAAHLSGRALDLAGGAGSYLSLLPPTLRVEHTDIVGADARIDINKPLPFTDGSFEHVFLFNALYIAENPEALVREICRVLKPSGSALIASPFMQNEMREPHDYRRLTSEGLERLFATAGITDYSITPYGERFSVAANLLHPFLLFGILRLPFYALALGLDRITPKRVHMAHPAPIGYFCVLKK